jgi:glycosyltransferase involved in cell wall biosynthesis
MTVLPHGNYLFFRDYITPNTHPPLPVDGKPVVLFFGPKKHKGIDVFAAAATKTKTSFTTWVVGPTTPEAEEAVSRLDSDPTVYVDTGYVPDEKIPDYFEYADIVVLPYRSGTTSGAVHLARAFENAVITSDLSCFTNVVEHDGDGYVLEENTPESLADSIDELVSNPERAQTLAIAGLETECSSRFDWSRIARETVRVYEMSLR